MERKLVMSEVEFMKKYTELVEKNILDGKILKINRGSNSMYENEIHFYNGESKNSSLLIAIERQDNSDNTGILEDLSGYDTRVLNLVVKNVNSTFDNGEILYSNTVIEFSDNLRYGNKKFYVEDLDFALEISRKRRERSHNRYKAEIDVYLVPSKNLLKLLKNVKGFKNAKSDKLLISRKSYGYKITNTSLKSFPEYYVEFNRGL